MKPRSCESGYFLLDVIIALSLLSFVLLSIAHVYELTLGLYQRINNSLAAQQDVRLALDRVARTLRETSNTYGRLRIYPPESGCAGAYQGCFGYVTARNANCAGAFQVIGGAPNWQATLYLWRDTASNELRLRCDPGRTFPVAKWPPPALDSYTVIGRNVATVSFTTEPDGVSRPASIAIAIQEQVSATSRQAAAVFFNETVFLPKN